MWFYRINNMETFPPLHKEFSGIQHFWQLIWLLKWWLFICLVEIVSINEYLTPQTGSSMHPTMKVTSHSSGRWARNERSLHSPTKSYAWITEIISNEEHLFCTFNMTVSSCSSVFVVLFSIVEDTVERRFPVD